MTKSCDLHLTSKQKSRFWSKVDVKGPDECWEWQGAKSSRGYGSFKVGGKIYKVHRIIWMIYKGSIPHGKLICHHCDNEPCVNVKHLFMGTQKDNMQDMIKKGRGNKAIGDIHGSRTHPEKLACGEKHGLSVLMELEVLTIRKMVKAGFSQTETARIFRVGLPAVNKIILRKTWRHI